MTTYTAEDFKRAEFATRDASYIARNAMRCNEDSPTPWQGQYGAWSDDQMADSGWVPVPAGSYTRTDERVESDPRSNVGLAKHFRDQRDELEHRLNLAVMASEHNSERAEKAERALAEMTAHRDQCRDTAIKWQMEANRAEQPRALTPDAIESVLHDILPLTANRLGEDDIASIASDLYLALTAPARDPRAEKIQADLASAEEPEMDDENRRLIADHLAALGYRKTGAES